MGNTADFEEWSITNPQGDSTLSFRKRADDPEWISVYFNAIECIKTFHVGAGLGVCDYDFTNNEHPHRVHQDFARAVWDGLTQRVGWKEKSKVTYSHGRTVVNYP